MSADLGQQFQRFADDCERDQAALERDERRWARHPGRRLHFGERNPRGEQSPLFADDGAAGPLFRQTGGTTE